MEVGPGLQHETLKSAFAVAGEYDRILVHPGIYDEQLEMSLKVPFELVGVGELGSVILVVCLECVALSGRLSNLVLRAPWFTNFVLKVMHSLLVGGWGGGGGGAGWDGVCVCVLGGGRAVCVCVCVWLGLSVSSAFVCVDR